MSRNIGLSHHPPVRGNFVPKFKVVKILVNMKEMRVLLFHLIFAFPCEFGSPLGVPANLHDGYATLFCLFDLSVHDFYWFFHKVEALVDLDLVEWNNKSLVGQTLFQV